MRTTTTGGSQLRRLPLRALHRHQDGLVRAVAENRGDFAGGQERLHPPSSQWRIAHGPEHGTAGFWCLETPRIAAGKAYEGVTSIFRLG
jgi:hypothetical protein